MKRFVLLNLVFTGISLTAALVVAAVLAYLHASLRGDLLPNGTTALNGPTALWVGVNFRHYLPGFLAFGSAFGVAVGQVQFIAWIFRQEVG